MGGRTEYAQRMLRLFGIPESEIAETLRVAEPSIEGFEGLEITTCLRRGEVEVVVRHEPRARRRPSTRCSALIAERHERTLFSTDGSTSTTRWPSCSPGAGWRWPSPARPG